MVRQAHHERNQLFAVRPELVEGLNQSFFNECLNYRLIVMNTPFLDFLNALIAYLNAVEPVASGTVLRVEFNPGCRQAGDGQVLLDVGRWGSAEAPVEQVGVCLNNKGVSRRFGGFAEPPTVSGLVLEPPPGQWGHWLALWGSGAALGQRLSQLTLVVEDAAPDAVLALLLWLARVNGVALLTLQQPRLKQWLAAVRRWETTGMADDPFNSWAALLSHGRYAATASCQGRFDFNAAWHDALLFTATLLLREADPDAVPELWELPAYRRARALLGSEQRNYLNSLAYAVRLQLLMPISGLEPGKDVLVDVYLASETWPSGARKLFVRLDREHTYTGTGFAVMGVHRPDPRIVGTGDDMVVSVNPILGIDLKALWHELERLENERWQGQRPSDDPRPIKSYADGGGYNQPWWDDNGRYTLLGAPRTLTDGHLGSRLGWQDVIEALWRCYQPCRGLRVNDALQGDGDAPVNLQQCRHQKYRHDGGDEAFNKYFVALCWSYDTRESGALLEVPTVQRQLAALIVSGRPAAAHELGKLAGAGRV